MRKRHFKSMKEGYHSPNSEQLAEQLQFEFPSKLSIEESKLSIEESNILI